MPVNARTFLVTCYLNWPVFAGWAIFFAGAIGAEIYRNKAERAPGRSLERFRYRRNAIVCDVLQGAGGFLFFGFMFFVVPLLVWTNRLNAVVIGTMPPRTFQGASARMTVLAPFCFGLLLLLLCSKGILTGVKKTLGDLRKAVRAVARARRKKEK